MNEFEKLMQLLSDIDVELGRIHDAQAFLLNTSQIATFKAGLTSLLEKAKSI